MIRSVRKLACSAATPSKDLSSSCALCAGRRLPQPAALRLPRSGRANGFDSFGHYRVLITDSNDYVVAPQTGCIANFLEPTTTSAPELGEQPTDRERKREQPADVGDATTESGGAQFEPETRPPPTRRPRPRRRATPDTRAFMRMSDAETLLDFLIGDQGAGATGGEAMSLRGGVACEH